MTRRMFLRFFAGACLACGGLGGGGYAFLRKDMFGALPAGGLEKTLMRSPHYYNGEFHNLAERAVLKDDGSVLFSLFRYLLEKKENPFPENPVPVNTHAFENLNRVQDCLVWLGHSSFFLQCSGKRFLIDPVFSPYVSPFPFSIKAFAGTSAYAAEDLPFIDYVLVSHDHWDHLDYPTMKKLQPKTGKVVCGLGVSSHLMHWGFQRGQIIEGDWGDTVVSDNDININIVPAQHFSGRTLVRNKTLWCGFVLETKNLKLFFSGDSGYGEHFAGLGKKFGKIDIALLDCGQYNERWRFVHMVPEEAVQAASDLQASYLLPMHIGKFSLASHPRNEPFERVKTASSGKNFRLLTPMIGERLDLANLASAHFSSWWETLG